MDYYKKNLEALINYFKDGIKTCDERTLGFELEHFVIDNKTGKTVGYYDKHGIHDILNYLAAFYPNRTYSRDTYLIGLAREHSNITLEPAAQLEISRGPYSTIREVEDEYLFFIEKINTYLKKLDYSLKLTGYHPKSKIDELKLIPKKRYEFMLQYFESTGNHGKNMMKGTASTQVSVDYHNEEDFISKFRLANILSPVFSLITDNCPTFEGQKNNVCMKRTVIWNDVDPDRSMIVKDALDKKFGFKEYAEYILNSPAILVLDENDKTTFTGNSPVKDIYHNKLLSTKEIEHIISMFFPDVRLKNYIEIRMADSMPLDYALSYMALIKGLFYCNICISNLLIKFKNITNKDVAESKLDLIKNKYAGKIYGIPAGELIDELLITAKNHLPENEQDYLTPLLNLAKNRKTLTEAISE